LLKVISFSERRYIDQLLYLFAVPQKFGIDCMAFIYPSSNQPIPNMGHVAMAIFISPGRKWHDRKVIYTEFTPLK
jgi:hypothetical protein